MSREFHIEDYGGADDALAALEALQEKQKKRKRRSELVLVILAAGMVLLMLLMSRQDSDRQDTATAAVMDTAVVITVWGQDAQPYADTLAELDGVFSAYDSDAELYKLNAAGGGEMSDRMADILQKAVSYNRQFPSVDVTCGALIDIWGVVSDNPRVPSAQEIYTALATIGSDKLTIIGNNLTIASGTKIELGSCAKGYSCDVLYEMLQQNNAECAVVSFGSSALLYGEKPDGSAFTVSVKNPNSDGVLGTFTTGAGFVSTSGGYERNFTVNGTTYSHIMDLTTGSPAVTDLLSVTVVAKSGFASDFVSTAAYLGGSAGLAKYMNSDEYEILAVTREGKILVSDGLKESFTLTDKSFQIAE